MNELKERYPDDKILQKHIAAIERIPDWDIRHKKLRRYIVKHNLEADEYMDFSEEFAYTTRGAVKIWRANGKYHRDKKNAEGKTLPAYMSETETVWYNNGKIHRDDIDENGRTLPAVEHEQYKEWRINGKVHRVDLDENGVLLPALIYTNGDCTWYYEGTIHRDEIDENGQHLPAEINGNKKAWYYLGELHREDRDENGRRLPAYIDGDIKKWYHHGKYHRDDVDDEGKQLPAIVGTDFREWWVNGKLHRLDKDADGNVLPAAYGKWLISNLQYKCAKKLNSYVNDMLSYKRDMDSTKSWWKNGQPHRDGDGPAIIYNNGGQEWWKNGKLHRQDDQPAIDCQDLKVWAVNGRIGRNNDEPSIIVNYQGRVSKFWVSNNLFHRLGELPAVDALNGTWQEWWQYGKLHRQDDQPARIHGEGVKEWWQYGKLHRQDDQPAAIYSVDYHEWIMNIGIRNYNETYKKQIKIHERNGVMEWYVDGEHSQRPNLPNAVYGDGTQEWWKNGKLHRDDGLPAVIHPDGTMTYYQNGCVQALPT